MSLKDPSLFHPRWQRVGAQPEVEAENHLSESLQTAMKQRECGGKLSGNDQINAVHPVAMGGRNSETAAAQLEAKQVVLIT